MLKMVRSSARFSPDGKYRYNLERVWDPGKKLVCFVLLNASTADARKNDPTVRRLIGFADRWGYGGFWLGNAFGFKTMDPRQLCEPYNSDPIGLDNDRCLLEMVNDSDLTVAGWGNWGALGGRGDKVAELLTSQRELFCLGVTLRGQPKHPLYLRATATPVIYRGGVK